MSRFTRPPTPDEWCDAAAACLRENDVAASLGGSFADGSREIALAGLRARVQVWPSLKVAAKGPQAERDRALEVLQGAGFVDGWVAGATGKMRARVPAEHEDAPAATPAPAPLDVGPRDEKRAVALVLEKWAPEHWQAFRDGYARRAVLPLAEWAGLLAEAGIMASADGFALVDRDGLTLSPAEAGAYLRRDLEADMFGRESASPADERAAVLRFLRRELARFERARADGVAAGDPRVGKLQSWASLTRTYIAQIERGDHLQLPEDETP